MPYQTQLQFLRKIFARSHLQLLFVDPSAPIDMGIDLGLRKLAGMEELYESHFYAEFRKTLDQVIFRLRDPFLCNYLFFRLPTPNLEIVIVGPYLSQELTHEHLLELTEGKGLTPAQMQRLETYFSAVPVLTSDNALFTALDAFAEVLWGTDDYTVTEVGMEMPNPPRWEESSREAELVWSMKELERRYAYENELIRAVSMGQTQKVAQLMAGFNDLAFERRLSDPVRNLKNYCIITNTLLRKAAESGGVHPLYLDKASSSFARRIETLNSPKAVQTLMEEMFRTYCKLVRKTAVQSYSPPVQKVIVQINADLSADLSLKTLAHIQSLNASYLSDLFRQETGETLTNYVNRMRIEQAKSLLSSTKLQIQTIAQHCGILDVNYFSKLFKKHVGMSPMEWRRSTLPHKPI